MVAVQSHWKVVSFQLAVGIGFLLATATRQQLGDYNRWLPAWKAVGKNNNNSETLARFIPTNDKGWSGVFAKTQNTYSVLDRIVRRIVCSGTEDTLTNPTGGKIC